jgi:phage terminase large subunit GpA-like protein
MSAYCETDTHTISVMAATQVVKTEFLINITGYSAHLDPSSILFVQPTQNSAQAFSKERFQPTVDVTPVLSSLIAKPRVKGSENTIAHKSFRGGSLDFVGSNSPNDLASRPKRVILCDEIDKYPASAGDEGDPLWLAEERGSTYKAVGRAKFVRTCSPTEEETSRIGREYKSSDQRKCFLPCPHCGHQQIITWASIVWSKNDAGEGMPETAGISCGGCGVVWSERDKNRALDKLASLPDYGWRQTKPFVCCGDRQEPTNWDDRGRSLCGTCGVAAAYDGHAGFQIPKWLSKRHTIADVVGKFLTAKSDPHLLKIVTNTAFAELWKKQNQETFENSGLISRAEVYGPEDLPDQVLAITGFCDVQGDRLEVQLIGWGSDEEAWPFLYEVINLDPSQQQAWQELDRLRLRIFKTRDGRSLRVAAFGVDYGGNHGAEVEAYCTARRGQRVFATVGRGGKRPMWPITASQTKNKKPLHVTGVDTAKDAIFGRLKIQAASEDRRQPGFIHFPAGENFGPQYFEQLTGSERRVTRKRLGQNVTVWERVSGTRNEVLDTFVGALCVRRSLPKRIDRTLSMSTATKGTHDTSVTVGVPEQVSAEPRQSIAAQAPQRTEPKQNNWMSGAPRSKGWLS